MCLISKIQYDESTGIHIAVPARRRAVPWDTRNQCRGGDFEGHSWVLMLFSFAVSQKIPMASVHATQVWFGDMEIKKNSIFCFETTARAGMPERAVEMKNENFRKKMVRWGTEPRTLLPDGQIMMLSYWLNIVRHYNDIK